MLFKKKKCRYKFILLILSMNKLHYQHQAFSYSNELLTAYRSTGDLQSCKQTKIFIVLPILTKTYMYGEHSLPMLPQFYRIISLTLYYYNRQISVCS